MKTDLTTAIEKEYRKAQDYYASNLQQSEENAEQFFQSKQPQEIDKDVSEYFKSIVTTDIADAVEHTLADIMPAFSSESPVSFLPKGPEDEQKAFLETEVVNDLFMQQNNGYTTLLAACSDALLYRRGYIHVNVTEKKQVEYATLENTTLEQVTMAQFQATQQGQQIEIIDLEGEMDETEDGELLNSSVTVKLRKTTTINSLDIESFDPDELLVNPEHEEVDLDSARFISRERRMTAGELIQLGYDPEVIKKIPTYSQTSRVLKSSDDYYTDSEYSHDSSRPILVAYIYFRVDDDSDGIPELRHIFAAGNFPSNFTILSNEPIDTQPFAAGVPFLYAHKYYGISLYDKLKQIQIVKTKVLRQLLTAGERAVRGRLGVVGNQANINDVAETIFGGIVRLTTPTGVVPIPADRFPNEVMSLIDYANKWRSEAGGSAIDKANEEIAVGGDTAHGLERMMSAMEQLNSLVAKLLAETLVKQTYRKIHHLYRQHWGEETNIKIEGNWLSTTPSEWPAERKIGTAVGLTMGDRMRMAANYDRMILSHNELANMGSTLVDEKNLYRLHVNRAKAMGIPSPYSYFLDPDSSEGQQAQQQKNQMMQQKQQTDQQMAVMQNNLLKEVEAIRNLGKTQVQELKNQMDAAGLAEDSQKAFDELALKYDELAVKMVELNAKYDGDPVPDTRPSAV